MKTKIWITGLAMATAMSATAPVMAEGEVYIPMPVYRVGPYATGGTGYFGGIIDYYTLMNMKEGGVGGMKIIWNECETNYNDQKGVECYHRQKEFQGKKALFFDPLSVGISTSLVAQGRKDKIAIIAVNHGRTEGQRGDVFPYYFMPGINTYDEHSIITAYIGELEGGMENLAGKKIVLLFHGSTYGREAVEFTHMLCEKHNCSSEAIEVPHPGNEQTSQWLKIRRSKPDYVVLRGWGVMNPVAMQTGVRMGFPISNLIGNIWSNDDGDVKPAGSSANGYQAITTHPTGRVAKVIDEIVANLYDQGMGDLEDKSRIGSNYWNLGVMAGVIHLEAVRVAQARFGADVNSAQVRWGFENLNLDTARLTELGANGLVPEIKTNCMDHVGGHQAKFMRWVYAETKWEVASDWIDGDVELSQAIIDAKAENAIENEGITPRDCNDPAQRDDFEV